jgi:hypothetical protein
MIRAHILPSIDSVYAAERIRAEALASAGKNLDSVRTFCLIDYWLRPDGFYDYQPQYQHRANAYLLTQVRNYLTNRAYTRQDTTVIIVGVEDVVLPELDRLLTNFSVNVYPVHHV